MSIEQDVLGACIIDPDALVTAMQYLGPQSFSNARHRTIFEAMLKLDGEDKPVDLVTLAESLEGKVQASYLSNLAANIHTTANIEYYAEMVAKEAQQREATRIYGEALRMIGGGDDVTDVVSWADGQMVDVLEQRAGGLVSINDVAHERWGQYEEMAERGDSITGIPSGFKSIDRILGGFAKTEMSVLAGRPGLGKSAIAANIAVRSAKQGTKVAIFSLEMDRKHIFDRVLAAEVGLNVRELRTGKFTDWTKAAEGMSRLTELPIWMDDARSLTTTQIRAQCRRLHKQHGLDLVIVDYLQLLADRTGEQRHREIGLMCKTLRNMTKDFDGAVLLLAQLNRKSEQETRRPRKSDLRESGEIEQDSDVILFLHCDEEEKKKEDGEPRRIDFIIGKNRHGPEGSIPLRFEGQHTRFREVVRA